MMRLHIAADHHIGDLYHCLHARRQCRPHTKVTVIQCNAGRGLKSQPFSSGNVNVRSRLAFLDQVYAYDGVSTRAKTTMSRNLPEKNASQSTFPALVAAFAAVTIWGASAAATAVAGRVMPPELIGGLRSLLGGTILLPVLLRFRDRLPPT